LAASPTQEDATWSSVLDTLRGCGPGDALVDVDGNTREAGSARHSIRAMAGRDRTVATDSAPRGAGAPIAFLSESDAEAVCGVRDRSASGDLSVLLVEDLCRFIVCRDGALVGFNEVTAAL
jgi:hypothetical protein